MRKLRIDRFEGTYAYCEGGDRKFFAIEKSELPPGAKPGDVLVITDDGGIAIDEAAGQTRRKKS